jgi:Rps23 Pro-64 3,4-dihydroxylase Tpa1-like proline 4-hydroxylase
MELINLASLTGRLGTIKNDFQSKKPFKYVLFDNFFLAEKAEEIYQNYPTIENSSWDGTTYLDQKNKFRKSEFDKDSIMDKVFKELNSATFLHWLQEITQLEDTIIADPGLFGGGLHQSTNGAFLNVHVDYNIHPDTKFHRRLNVIIFMNKDWQEEYEGHLELWDFSKNKKILLAKIAPTFNRCVIFETNEVSFHGHPKPLKTPSNVNRKSIATYYYTKTRPANESVADHNTIYVNTEGTSGHVKRFAAGIKAFVERINRKF